MMILNGKEMREMMFTKCQDTCAKFSVAIGPSNPIELIAACVAAEVVAENLKKTPWFNDELYRIFKEDVRPGVQIYMGDFDGVMSMEKPPEVQAMFEEMFKNQEGK